jgi:outer membrane protein assembly factor BamD (BamD/ComL family)
MLKPQKRLTRREKTLMKEDKLVSAWFKTMDYVEKNSRNFLFGVAAVALLAGGWYYYKWHLQQQEQQASVLFAVGKQAFDNQSYDAAIDSLGKLTNKYSGTASAGVGTVFLANAFMQKKDYATAERYYRAYLEDYDDDEVLSVAAAGGVAATLEERGEHARAAELYEKAARNYAESYRAPELLLHAARCHRAIQNLEAARRVLAALLEKYPDSKFSEEAKLLQAELQS